MVLEPNVGLLNVACHLITRISHFRPLTGPYLRPRSRRTEALCAARQLE